MFNVWVLDVVVGLLFCSSVDDKLLRLLPWFLVLSILLVMSLDVYDDFDRCLFVLCVSCLCIDEYWIDFGLLGLIWCLVDMDGMRYKCLFLFFDVLFFELAVSYRSMCEL